MFQLNTKALVMPVGKRASSATDGKLRAIHVAWISAIPAEMKASLARLAVNPSLGLDDTNPAIVILAKLTLPFFGIKLGITAISDTDLK